jgi:ATP-binding cassette, subfamily B, bacterial CvaB/MchF/RaxB
MNKIHPAIPTAKTGFQKTKLPKKAIPTSSTSSTTQLKAKR